MSGVTVGCHLCSNPFCYQRNRSWGWRPLLRWMQKMDFAIQYKLLLLWREYVGYLSFEDVGFKITGCDITWMQQDIFNPV